MTKAHIESGTQNLAAALAAFQADLPSVTLDGDNPHFKSKFATLANVTKIVLPKLSAHGLAFTATPNVTEHGFVMEAHLIHSSGERLSASFPITGTDPQKVGSAVTYYRRYALAALTGVVADADDDGNAASIPSPAERTVAKAKAAVKPPTGDAPLDAAKAKIQAWIGGDEAKRVEANTAQTKHKAEGKTGLALLEAVIQEVGA